MTAHRSITLPASPRNLGPFEELPPHMRKPGQLLSRTWQAPVVHGVTAIWEERIRGYWERVMLRYGVVVSAPRNEYDAATGTITTFAALTAVLSGVQRYPKRQSEAVH